VQGPAVCEKVAPFAPVASLRTLLTQSLRVGVSPMNSSEPPSPIPSPIVHAQSKVTSVVPRFTGLVGASSPPPKIMYRPTISTSALQSQHRGQLRRFAQGCAHGWETGRLL
jgi:hypothetical protein